jgi:hypothetical protein
MINETELIIDIANSVNLNVRVKDLARPECIQLIDAYLDNLKNVKNKDELKNKIYSYLMTDYSFICSDKSLISDDLYSPALPSEMGDSLKSEKNTYTVQ